MARVLNKDGGPFSFPAPVGMSIQDIHDMACKLGAKCGHEAANPDNDPDDAGKALKDLQEGNDAQRRAIFARLNEDGDVSKEHPIVQHAHKYGVVNIGQLSKEEHSHLNDAVRRGVLQKSTNFDFPIPKQSFVRPFPKSFDPDDDTLVVFGGSVKALPGGKVTGLLVRYSGAADPDLTRDFFDAATNTGPHTLTPIYYQHGKDPQLKGRQIGTGTLRRDDVGVWVDAQLNLRDEYEKMIYQLAQDGKLGWSSGTAAHLVERERIGKSFHIKTWLLGLDASLTPTPAEPRNSALPLKSLFPEQPHPAGQPDGPAPEGAVGGQGASTRIPDDLLAAGRLFRLREDLRK